MLLQIYGLISFRLCQIANTYFNCVLCSFPPIADESETSSEEDSDVSCFDEEDVSWISWFCSQKGNEFFCEVDDDYILDDFNLSGLNNIVSYYDYALDLILDAESSHGNQVYLLSQITEHIRYLIHEYMS